MKSKFNNMVTDSDAVQQLRENPKSFKLTDPDDPRWCDFDYDHFRAALKATNDPRALRMLTLDDNALREVLARSGAINAIQGKDRLKPS